VAAVLLATATAGAAPRRTTRTKKTASPPTADLYGGYSYTHAGQASLHGWGLAGSYRLQGSLRLVVDLTGHYGSFAGASLSQTALMAGVRRTWSVRGLTPFVDGLAGFARTSTSFGAISGSGTDWGVAFGGGVDYPLSERWAARGLAQLRLLHGEGAWDTDPRISIGAVYRFGL
jgi:hypothetical protein